MSPIEREARVAVAEEVARWKEIHDAEIARNEKEATSRRRATTWALVLSSLGGLGIGVAAGWSYVETVLENSLKERIQRRIDDIRVPYTDLLNSMRQEVSTAHDDAKETISSLRSRASLLEADIAKTHTTLVTLAAKSDQQTRQWLVHLDQLLELRAKFEEAAREATGDEHLLLMSEIVELEELTNTFAHADADFKKRIQAIESHLDLSTKK